MDLYENIFRRKSTRKYDMSPLDGATLAKLTAFADGLKPLHPEIKTAYEITGNVKNIFPVKAPHYFLLYSEKQDDYLENTGFMWQQMDLYLSGLGLGSCWLGMVKPSGEAKAGLSFVIALAFGKAQGSPYREQAGFKRKTLAEISSGGDSRIEAARLAPSANNTQSWFFESAGGAIDVYQKNLNPAMTLLYGRFNSIDMGIALCHLCLANGHEGREFIFEKQTGKEKKGYTYTGTVK